jgi:two-component system, OmpR family, phosphate regulon sensor histidine kinase PhoR
VDLKHKHRPGLGLGLALVRQLTQALGGEVSVESRLGGGSTFEVQVH